MVVNLKLLLFQEKPLINHGNGVGGGGEKEKRVSLNLSPEKKILVDVINETKPAKVP